MTDRIADQRIVSSDFRPAWWLRNRHTQTIFPSLPWPAAPRPSLRREMLELPDGDAVAVDWVNMSAAATSETLVLVVLHGLESSADSTYARQLLSAAGEHGWQAAVLHFRDCGDYRNRLPRRYHAGETNDLRYFLGKLRTDGQIGPMMAVGYSLGGNVLLKYLGEERGTTPLDAAAAVSVPLSLSICADALTIGFSRIYQKHLLNRMKRAVSRKFDPHTAAFDWHRAMRATTFSEFDDAVTAPLHGFSGKDEYYNRCSSAQFLCDIDRPTLIINAQDDPFMAEDMIPSPDQLSDQVTLELSERGGHVGFISGGMPWRPEYYLPGRIINFLDGRISEPDAATHALPGM